MCIPPSIRHSFPAGTINFAIRSSMDSGRLAEAVRKAVAAVDPAVPLTEFHTQTALIDRLLRTERLLGFVSAAFGLVALTLAAIGLGGVLAYAVARRTNEIGVRMALGAAAGDVIRMVLRDSLWMVGLGDCDRSAMRLHHRPGFEDGPLPPRAPRSGNCRIGVRRAARRGSPCGLVSGTPCRANRSHDRTS